MFDRFIQLFCKTNFWLEVLLCFFFFGTLSFLHVIYLVLKKMVFLTICVKNRLKSIDLWLKEELIPNFFFHRLFLFLRVNICKTWTCFRICFWLTEFSSPTSGKPSLSIRRLSSYTLTGIMIRLITKLNVGFLIIRTKSNFPKHTKHNLQFIAVSYLHISPKDYMRIKRWLSVYTNTFRIDTAEMCSHVYFRDISI